MSPLPVQMENHWAAQPGVDPVRPRLMWHVLFGGYPEVADLVSSAQARLRGLPGLDLVPREWLHMTTLTAGFADEVNEPQLDTMVSHARDRLEQVPPVSVTVGRVLYHPRAIMLQAGVAADLEPVLYAIEAATRDATGCDTELYHNPWVPHITVAYSNSVQPAAPLIGALGLRLPSRTVRIRSVTLVSQAPEQRWTWQVVGDVPLGSLA